MRSVDVEKSKKKRFRKRSLYARFVVGGDYLPLFKGLIKALKDGIYDEIPLTVSHEGLRITYMDPSRVMMADVVLGSYCFYEYEVSSLSDIPIAELPKTVVVYADDILYALNDIKGMDVSFEVKAVFREEDELTLDKPRTLTISAGSEVYDFDLIEVREDLPPVPKIDFHAKVTVVLKDFIKKIKKLSKRYNEAVFTAKDKSFTILSKGDTSTGKLVLSNGSDMLINLEADGEQKAIYSINNLLAVLPNLGEIATLEFASDLPLKTSIKTGIDAQIDFYLAPRIID